MTKVDLIQKIKNSVNLKSSLIFARTTPSQKRMIV